MADHRRLDAVCTYSGRALRPLDPRPADIDIEDIAYSLSNSTRFTGHGARQRGFPYTVAQHSVYVSQLCPNYPLEGLLHDASEYALSDIARPIKKAQHEFGEIYAAIEDNISRTIAEKYGLVYPWPDEVKVADDIMLGAEARDLMHPNFANFGMGKFPQAEKWPNTIRVWSHVMAEAEFLDRFARLSK